MEGTEAEVSRSGSPPVQVRKAVRIEAPPAVVWAVLTDLPGWRRWHRGIRFARLRGSLEAGTYCHWRIDGMNVLSVLDEVEEARRLSWAGRCFGARLGARWTLDPVDEGTEVELDQWVDGLLIRLLRRGVRKTVARSSEEWLTGLKAGAGERAGEEGMEA